VKTVVQEAIRYSAVSACALIIDITVLFILVHYLSRWYVALAAGFTFVWNFVARRQLLFIQRRSA
jgi:hypothetical protein